MDWEVIIRLALAMVCGGSIGLEREKGNRPAGFRTHTLVCVGSALVMLTSLYIFEMYHEVVNLDPARLGAQVISGVGFLGVGTIIRNGSHVYGLTTAASLWVVACMGLAIGAGFYWGAIVTIIFVYITLIVLKNLGGRFIDDSITIEIDVQLDKVQNELAKMMSIISEFDVQIEDLKISCNDGSRMCTKLLVKLPHNINSKDLFAKLSPVEGVSVNCDEIM